MVREGRGQIDGGRDMIIRVRIRVDARAVGSQVAAGGRPIDGIHVR